MYIKGGSEIKHFPVYMYEKTRGRGSHNVTRFTNQSICD